MSRFTRRGPRMKRALLLTSVSLLLTTVSSPLVQAGQPPKGYNTAEILWTATTNYGEVPLRRGFYDGDKINPYAEPGEDNIGVGFGIDKAWHKHRITNSGVIAYVLGANGKLKNLDGSKVIFGRRYTTMDCVPVEGVGTVCPDPDKGSDYDVIAVVDIDDWPLYHEWPAGDPLGVVTAYCEGYDGYCPWNINSPLVGDLAMV